MIPFKERINILKEELEELEKKALEMLGTKRLNFIKDVSRMPPIENCIKYTSLRVYPVESLGARCVILSSYLYSEVGFIVFDGYGHYNDGFGSGEVIEIRGVKFRLACGCCSPYTIGLPEEFSKNKETQDLKTYFMNNIRNTCKKNGIKKLFFENWNTFATEDKDNVLLVNMKKLKEEIDAWRFITAFKDVSLANGSFFINENEI